MSVLYRVYYDDGNYYDGQPYAAPAFGVIAVIQADRDTGRHLITNKDYYIWDDGRWWGVDMIGLIDYLQRPGPRKVVFGRLIDTEKYYEIIKKANDDLDLPERTGWRESEVRV